MTAAAAALGITPLETRRDVVVRLAVAAERFGYSAFSVAEGWGYDAGPLLAEVALRTSRIQLCTGVVNVWGRSAAGLAMLATTLADLSGGRFALGLGAGSPELAEGLHDVRFEAPVERLGRVIRQVRRLIDGERLVPAEPGQVRPLRLAVPPAHPIPIRLAALGPCSVRLAGELADVWNPFLLPRSLLAEATGWLAEGAERGRRETLPRVSPCLPLAVASDPAEVERLASWWVGFYLTSMGPLYARTLNRAGFGAAVELVRSCGGASAVDPLPPGARVLVDELLLHGDADQARAGLDRWHQAGVRSAVLVLPPGRPLDELLDTVAALAPRH